MDQQNLLVGLDISKGYADIQILNQSGHQPLLPCFKLYDTEKGRNKLLKKLQVYLDAGVANIFCGMESTGGYENNWYTLLAEFDSRVQVSRINPKGVKSFGEAGLQRSSNDQTAAKLIASYLNCYQHKLVFHSSDHPFDPRFFEGRKLVKTHSLITKQITQCQNQLEKLIYQYLPQLVQFIRKGMPKWMLEVLSKYPCGAAISKAGLKRLIKIKGLSKSKAQKLLEALDTAKAVSPSIKMNIEILVGQIIQQQHTKEKLDKELTKNYSQLDGVDLVKSVIGIGKPSAVRLILEIENIDRFESVKNLVSYFGMDPVLKQSGDGTKKCQISKKGRSQVRATLYMCAISSLKWNKELKALYSKHRKKSKNHYQAICVVMHKLLRIIFGVLKSKQPYDIDFETKTIKAKTQKVNKKKENQPKKIVEKNAPISKRKLKAIEKQEDVLIE